MQNMQNYYFEALANASETAFFYPFEVAVTPDIASTLINCFSIIAFDKSCLACFKFGLPPCPFHSS